MNKKLSIIMLISFVFLSGCKSKDYTVPVLTEPIGSAMDTAVVEKGDIYELKTYDAKIYPEVSEVSFDVNGKVKKLEIYLGQQVQKGDALISLDDTDVLKEIKTLEDERKDIQINNEYNNSLKNLDLQIQELNIQQKQDESASDIDVAQMLANYDKARLEQNQDVELQQYDINKRQKKIDDLKSKLDKNVLKAPYSGSVAYIKELHKNSEISAKDTVVIITDNSKLHLQSEYLEEAIIKNASQIYALINGKEYDIEAMPLTTSEQIKMKNGLGTVESSFSIKNDGDFAEGDYGCICIKDKLKTDVLIIPKNALYSDAKGNFVYRMLAGTVERKYVEIGTTTNIQVEIISGLEEGDVVYVQG